MQFSWASILLLASAAASTVSAAVAPIQKRTPGQTVAYYGQKFGVDHRSLESYCADPTIDIIVLSFLHRLYGASGLPGTNFSGYCGSVSGTDIAQCMNWEQTIPACQANGKKIFISIGGATMTEALTSPNAAQSLARQIWDLVGEGQGLIPYRPFGRAIVDGIDLDIENHHPEHWTEFISEFRALAAREGVRTYQIAAAPQCPRPDASLGDTVYAVDLLFVQFYNNPSCEGWAIPDSFRGWSDDIRNRGVPGAKIFVGVPACASAECAGSGYVDPGTLKSILGSVKGVDNYGGVMTWEAVMANNNQAGGQNFLMAMREGA